MNNKYLAPTNIKIVELFAIKWYNDYVTLLLHVRNSYAIA